VKRVRMVGMKDLVLQNLGRPREWAPTGVMGNIRCLHVSLLRHDRVVPSRSEGVARLHAAWRGQHGLHRRRLGSCMRGNSVRWRRHLWATRTARTREMAHCRVHVLVLVLGMVVLVLMLLLLLLLLQLLLLW